jgi:hypothetical protein
MGGEERGAAAGVRGGDDGSAIADDLKLARFIQTGATVHGFQNREYQKKAEKKTRPFRGKSRPENMAGAVVAMNGGGKLTGAHEDSPRDHHSRR